MNEVLFRADNQSKLQVVDVPYSSNSVVVPDVRRLKRHVLQERHRGASHDSISVPPTIAALVKGFVASERFPDAAINREGMRDRDSTGDSGSMSSVGRNLLTYMLRSEISNLRTENFNVPSIRNWFSS